MNKFDERGEAAIARLRLNPEFNEERYRRLGPVKYWMYENNHKHMRQSVATPHELPPQDQRCTATLHGSDKQCVEVQGHGPVMDQHGEVWDHKCFGDNDAIFWRKTPKKKKDETIVEPEKRNHDKASIIATRIVIIGGASCATAIVCTFVGIICVTLWRVFVS